MLTTAGFADVGFTDLREPVFYGASVDDAYDAMLRLRHAREPAAGIDRPALSRLRSMLGEHATSDGVLFDSAAWIITARRR
jgi:hypothetical protein